MTPPQASSPTCIPHPAATTLVCPYMCPHATLHEVLVSRFKGEWLLSKGTPESCGPVKSPKSPASVSCQEKACLGLKCVQKSYSLMKNCGCQSTTVELRLLHINDSTSAVLALQYPNIGNISVRAFPSVNCQTCKSWEDQQKQSHCVTHKKCSLSW